MTPELAGMIDHTLLQPEALDQQIERLCAEAVEYRFAAVCVNPFWVPLAAALIGSAPVAVCSVVGFPFGASRPAVKAVEARTAIDEGATEIDVVINLGTLKSGDLGEVASDIQAVREATEGRLLKVIIESAALTEDEVVDAVNLAAAAGADFVKTSTGYHPSGGASVADVAAIVAALRGRPLGVKASGGIRTREFALELIAAGATRLGASSGIALLSS
jgi:deoxyribose-phosphate aldolase